jgi:hypothetical protein
MFPSTKWLIRALRSLADGTETVIDLLAMFISVGLERLRRNAFGIAPAGGNPFIGILPYTRVHLADSGTSENIVALRHDVDAIFGRGRDGSRDWHVVTDVAKYTVNGRMNAESLADDGIHDRERAQFFVSH